MPSPSQAWHSALAARPHLDNPHALGVRQAGRQTAGAEAGVPATPRETSPRDHGAIGLNSDA